MNSASVEVSLIKPIPDIRSEARMHALSNELLNLFNNNKDIINVETNHKFDKNAYYDLYNSISYNNETVIFNFRLVTSKIFRELIKSLTDAHVEEKSDSTIKSEEFIHESDYAYSCEYFVSIKMNDLIKFLLRIKLHKLFNIYYNKIVAEIDKEISYQIRAKNVFSDIMSKCNYQDTKYHHEYIFTSLDEISTINKSKNIKLVIKNIDEFTSTSLISKTNKVEVHFKLLTENGIEREIRSLICNSANINAYQIEFIESYCKSNNISINSLIPCRKICSQCTNNKQQLLKIIDGRESPCPIFIEKKLNKSNVVFDELTKDLEENPENPYYKLLTKIKE
jgi:hypothetical protein